MKLPFLHQEVEVSTDLRESNDILDNPDALKARIAADGYLLIRGLHDKEAIRTARQQILEKLAAKGMLAPDTPLMDGIFNPDYPEPTSTGSMGNKALTQMPAFKAVVEGKPVMNFFKQFLGGEGADIRFQMASYGGTRGQAPQFITILFLWAEARKTSIPVGPPSAMYHSIWFHWFCLVQPIEKVRATYGQSDVDRDLIEGHFSDNPLENR